MTPKTIEAYLREYIANNIIDFAVRGRVEKDGAVTFYIRPQNANGETLDFKAMFNTLVPLNKLPPGSITKRVIINGKYHDLKNDVITYDEIATLTGQRNPTITYSNGSLGARGTLAEGRGVDIVDGMIINAAETNKA